MPAASRRPSAASSWQEDSGFERCHACDRKAAEEVGRTQVRRKYLCHAGLYEVALPVTEKRRTVATILFGQMLDDAPREEQWRRVAAGAPGTRTRMRCIRRFCVCAGSRPVR